MKIRKSFLHISIGLIIFTSIFITILIYPGYQSIISQIESSENPADSSFVLDSTSAYDLFSEDNIKSMSLKDIQFHIGILENYREPLPGKQEEIDSLIKRLEHESDGRGF